MTETTPFNNNIVEYTQKLEQRIDELELRIEKLEKKNSSIKKTKCYNCGKMGHIAKYCSQKEETKEDSCPDCGSTKFISGKGSDLFPDSKYSASSTWYNICAKCKCILSYTY
jgi:hypothetical protein